MGAANSESALRYRRMRIDDYDAVIALWRRCDGVSLRDADSRAGIARYLERNPGLSFVAVRGATLVGTIMAGHDGKRGYIQHLAVDADLRQQGIGGALVERSIAALGELGLLKTHVHVLQRNAGGRTFWANRGWIQREEIVMYSFIDGDNPDV